MRALLDVNVLVALLDADHVHHERSLDWLAAHPRQGWASCPLTENGVVRVMSSAGYPNPLPTSVVADRLARAIRHPAHAFWAADVSLLDDAIADRARIHGPRQVSDLYLLALAVRHEGRLVTFDRGIPISAVRGATARHIVVL